MSKINPNVTIIKKVNNTDKLVKRRNDELNKIKHVCWNFNLNGAEPEEKIIPIGECMFLDTTNIIPKCNLDEEKRNCKELIKEIFIYKMPCKYFKTNSEYNRIKYNL